MPVDGNSIWCCTWVGAELLHVGWCRCMWVGAALRCMWVGAALPLHVGWCHTATTWGLMPLHVGWCRTLPLHVGWCWWSLHEMLLTCTCQEIWNSRFRSMHTSLIDMSTIAAHHGRQKHRRNSSRNWSNVIQASNTSGPTTAYHVLFRLHYALINLTEFREETYLFHDCYSNDFK